MKIEKNIKRVTVGNTDIRRIMNGGGILWQRIDDTTGSPGPKKLIGGNMQAGFFGEVPISEFISGEELINTLIKYRGTRQFTDEPWLKFAYLNKIEFIAKKPILTSVSYNELKSYNLIFGDKTINVLGKTYKVRLIKGKNEGEQDDEKNYKGEILHNSEWNKLFLPIHENAPASWSYQENVNSITENWNIKYTNKDLLIGHYDNGSYCWCQESGDSSYDALVRGGKDISYSESVGRSKHSSYYGWRPVLELVE